MNYCYFVSVRYYHLHVCYDLLQHLCVFYDVARFLEEIVDLIYPLHFLLFHLVVLHLYDYCVLLINRLTIFSKSSLKLLLDTSIILSLFYEIINVTISIPTSSREYV